MRVAITFCDQPEHEDCENEKRYSFFGGSEAESLPHFIEFKTVVQAAFWTRALRAALVLPPLRFPAPDVAARAFIQLPYCSC
jgi:hypothetical protein